MERRLTILSLGRHTRLSGVLQVALENIPCRVISSEAFATADLQNQRVLFTVSLDEFGMAEGLQDLLLRLRSDLSALEGSIASVLLDGESELFTKEMARVLIFDANRAGCAFPMRGLVEATKNLRNYDVLSQVHQVDFLTAYTNAACELVRRLMVYEVEHMARPNILLLHASNRSSSNTLALGNYVADRLRARCDVNEIALYSGAIYDCNGCTFKTCTHFAMQQKCFYGGVVPDDVFPAVEQCDAILLCCPNYNDAPGAFFMALNNRLNALMLRGPMHERDLFAIVVSGYSGGDLVAKQLLGGFSLNKFLALPPRFCMLETANNPGTVMHEPGIIQRLNNFADGIVSRLINES